MDSPRYDTRTLSVAPGKVDELRKHWLTYEDAALAHKLQDEEISQHYDGNRVRNAQVREDLPVALEEQMKERQNAVEEQMRQLRLLREQEIQDAMLAKQLAEDSENGMYTMDNVGPPIPSSVKPPKSSPLRVPVPAGSAEDGNGRRFNNVNLMHSPTNSYRSSNDSLGSRTSIGGAAGGSHIARPSTSSSLSDIIAGTSSDGGRPKSIMKATSAYGRQESPVLGACALPPAGFEDDDDEGSFEEDRMIQEKLDEELALKLQKEMEVQELDKKIALEAQDREYARMVHHKEKERLRRAKERAKARAAAAAESSGSETFDAVVEVHTEGANGPGSAKYSSSCNNIFANQFPPAVPKLPEKTQRSSMPTDIGFRAAPKPLPPRPPPPSTYPAAVAQPQASSSSSSLQFRAPEVRNYFRNSHGSPTSSGAHGQPQESHNGQSRSEVVPPYMPMQGLYSSPKKRQK